MLGQPGLPMAQQQLRPQMPPAMISGNSGPLMGLQGGLSGVEPSGSSAWGDALLASELESLSLVEASGNLSQAIQFVPLAPGPGNPHSQALMKLGAGPDGLLQSADFTDIPSGGGDGFTVFSMQSGPGTGELGFANQGRASSNGLIAAGPEYLESGPRQAGSRQVQGQDEAGPSTSQQQGPEPRKGPGPRDSPRGGGAGGGGGGRGSERRNQGYRKLWQQVTKVGKGQKLSEAGGLQYCDMTVEDLLRIVMKLAPQESAVEAVEQGLYYLDSSATAALLKELAKQGQLKRSTEIFDWLRSLPQSHELYQLCDLYTYTTMISQCGSHQQLRRALELVAEMRSRGIDCNVHTYSALMNVCIKANELDLAQDVYKQMLDEGCTPNLVTYNILIDVFVKKGQWEEAVKSLDTLEQQGIQAEVRTYNTVISACNKSGQPEQALKVYERMLAAGIKPSATTYTALISAYGRSGQVEKALEIFQDMIRRGCERNVITYSSLIAACEKAGRWELALELFSKMHKENCKPNVVTYNSLIAACAHGGHWEKATEFFEQMGASGCKPDSITYAALISAYEKGGQWRRALKAFEQMQAQGCHPDAAVFNSLMEVLWQSGVILAQVRALQLWSLANRNGQFRIYTNSRQETDTLQYSTVALTTGAALVTVLRWLAELRSKLAKDGPGFFRQRVVMTLHKAKASRAEQPSMLIHEAVGGMLLGCGSPFTTSLQDHTVTLAAPSADLSMWLRSAAFAELIYLVQGGSIRKLPLDLLLSEDVAVAARCIEAFAAVKRLEETRIMDVRLYNAAVLQQRPQVVHLALKYGGAFAFREDTVYDGLMLFDRVMCSGVAFNPNLWPLCLCSCILLCAHQSEPRAPGAAAPPGGVQGPGVWPSYDSIALLTGFGVDALVAMERNICGWLQGDISAISVLRVVQLYQERLGHYLQEFKPADRTSKDLSALLAKVAASPVSVGVRASALAAGALAVLRRIKGVVPAWPMALQIMSGYSMSAGELPTCVLHVESLLQ